MDLLTDFQAGTAHTIHHTILDQISEKIVDTQAAMSTTKTEKATTGTTIEIKGTNRTHSMTREIIAIRSGMTTIKIETGSTKEDGQPSTNITETSLEHR